MNEGRVAILVVAWWSAGCGFSELTDLELSPRGTATVELLAGSIGGPGMLDARGGAARFAEPHGVAVTPGGITYVADTANCVIRKIDSEGEVSTFSGAPGLCGDADGPSSSARFNRPWGLALDDTGLLYVTDYANHALRRVDSAGAVVTLAGASTAPGGEDGVGSSGHFRNPAGLTFVRGVGLVVADQGNHTIRRVTLAGSVTTVAGLAGVAGHVDELGALARFFGPTGLVASADGTLYVSEVGSHTLRKITAAGAVSTYAGISNVFGAVNGPSDSSTFYAPQGLALDAAGTLYVGDSGNNLIRRVITSRTTYTYAGTGTAPGSVDGTAPSARFRTPSALALNSAGTLVISDSDNHSLRAIRADGTVSTLAGAAEQIGAQDGAGEAARFARPYGVVVTDRGVVYVADTRNHLIRQVTPLGDTSVWAGVRGTSGSADGQRTTATFADPRGLALDAQGNLYVADSTNHTVRKLTPAGRVTTVAGVAGARGNIDGPAAQARFDTPAAIAVDATGALYLTESSHVIRKISPEGYVTTLAGAFGLRGFEDGVGADARFSYPEGIAVDPDGVVYVADRGNHAIRAISRDGTVTTLAGSVEGFADGEGRQARFSSPTGLALSRAGELFVSDTGNHTLRKVTPLGATTTVAGAQTRSGIYLGAPAALAHPQGLAFWGNELVLCDSSAVLRLRWTPP